MDIETVRVQTKNAQYDIHIAEGVLGQAGALLAPLLHRPTLAIVTDANVARFHLDTLVTSLKNSGIATHVITLPAGEETKSFANLEALTDELLSHGVERNDMIAALGGGVIGDLTGFAAAILKRGCRFAQIPTTLLAQVDSSVGGKTAINAGAGKNLIGAFKQPDIVLSDLTVLDTLAPRDFAAGYAEIVKYGIIHDRAFFDWLTAEADLRDPGASAARKRAIKRSCEIKAKIVGRDEHEHAERALLNYGHTFGHALEAACGFGDRLLHGEGVAIGMVLAARFAEMIGHCEPGVGDKLAAHLRDVGLPTRTGDIAAGRDFSIDELMGHMSKDKKVEAGAITLILPETIGRASIVRDVDGAQIKQFWQSEIAGTVPTS